MDRKLVESAQGGDREAFSELAMDVSDRIFDAMVAGFEFIDHEPVPTDRVSGL